MDLIDYIKYIPNKPGIYFFKDKSNKILYIGKSKQLRIRVKSYFSETANAKCKAIILNSSKIDYLVSDTEIEINATTIDINGAVDISGALVVGGDFTVNGTTTTVNSTVMQAYKNGDFATVYGAWAKMDEADQTIGFIYEDLKELAYINGVDINKLDNTLLAQMKLSIDKVYKHGTLDRTKDPSSNDIDRDALAQALAIYRNNKGKGTTQERWEAATTAVDRMLGIGPDGELVKFNELGYRGSGPFLQKQSKSMGVIFVKNSGQQFGDLSSIEIDDRLRSKGLMRQELTGDARKTWS